MESKVKFRRGVNKVKFSLDELQDVMSESNSSVDSLIRLTRALQDINEEVNMLRNAIQFKGK